MSSITRVLHNTTWDYLTSRLPYRIGCSPKVVKEAIMTDIMHLVHDVEFWRTSADGAVEASFFAMRRLFETLLGCFGVLVLFPLRLPSTSLIQIYRHIILPSRILTTESEQNLKYCLTVTERCLISHFLNPKICVTCSASYLVS